MGTLLFWPFQLQQFGFEFTHFAAGLQQLIKEAITFFLQLFDQIILSPVRDLQIKHFLFQFTNPGDILFRNLL